MSANSGEDQIWFSSDDGESWTEAFIEKSPDKSLGQTDLTRLLRFTSIVGDRKNGYIWATDDSLGVNSAAIIKAKYKNNKLDVKNCSMAGQELCA